MNSIANTRTIPHISPIINAPNGETRSQPAVIPTRPARIPFNVRENEGLPEDKHSECCSHKVVTWNGMTLTVLVILAVARTKYYSSYKSKDTTNGMHYCGTGEIMECSTERVHHE